MLQFMGLQRVGHNSVTELNCDGEITSASEGFQDEDLVDTVEACCISSGFLGEGGGAKRRGA